MNTHPWPRAPISFALRLEHVAASNQPGVHSTSEKSFAQNRHEKSLTIVINGYRNSFVLRPDKSRPLTKNSPTSVCIRFS